MATGNTSGWRRTRQLSRRAWKAEGLVCAPGARRQSESTRGRVRGENGNPGRFEAFFGEVDDGHDLPLHATGSAGGLYDDWLFGYLRVPFNVADREETSLRELGPNLDAMRVVHLAYVGRADSGCQRALPDIRKRLQDHFSSKPTAIEAFRQWIVSH